MSWVDDIRIFLKPAELPNLPEEVSEYALASIVDCYTDSSFPDLQNCKIAIIGVKEDRRSPENTGSADAPDMVRKHLYQLFLSQKKLPIADIGNIEAGNTVDDTNFALHKVLSALVERKIVPIIIGGSQDLTYTNYIAYEKLETTINIATIDSCFDIGDLREDISADSFLSKIILHNPNYLFNYSHIGYQTYLVNPEMLELMQKLYFDTYRLGAISANLQETEPILRNADMLNIDMTAVRMSDAPGNKRALPNGFYGEQVCQMCRYAGASEKLTSLGIYEFNPHFDHNGQTAMLISQMIWCFLDGFIQRKEEYPLINKEDFFEFKVAMDQKGEDIVFFKSKKSDRWWMDVPYTTGDKNKFQRHHLVPCSYADYQTACAQEIPDKWWQTFQKLI